MEGLGASPADPVVDWRRGFTADNRIKVVDKIFGSVLKHFPPCDSTSQNEIKLLAQKIEQKFYESETCQDDYIKKISLKVMSIESKGRNRGQSNAPMPTYDTTRQIPADSAAQCSQQANVNKKLESTRQGNSEMNHQASHTYSAAIQAQGTQQRQNLHISHHQPLLPLAHLQYPQQPVTQDSSYLDSIKTSIQKFQAAISVPQFQLDPYSLNLQHTQLCSGEKEKAQGQVVLTASQQPTGLQTSISGMQWTPFHGKINGNSQMGNGMYRQKLFHQNRILGMCNQPFDGFLSDFLHPKSQVHELQFHQLSRMAMQYELQKMPVQQATMHVPQQIMTQQKNFMKQERETCQGIAASPQPHALFVQNQRLIQSQKGIDEASSSTSADSNAQTACLVDLKEEIYQKIKCLKYKHFSVLVAIYQRFQNVLQVNSLRESSNSNLQNHAKMVSFCNVIEQCIRMLQLSKDEIQPSHNDKLPWLESQINSIFNISRIKRNPTLQPNPLSQLQASQSLQKSNEMARVHNVTSKTFASASCIQHVSTSSAASHKSIIGPTHDSCLNLDSFQHGVINAPQNDNIHNLIRTSLVPPLLNGNLILSSGAVTSQQRHLGQQSGRQNVLEQKMRLIDHQKQIMIEENELKARPQFSHSRTISSLGQQPYLLHQNSQSRYTQVSASYCMVSSCPGVQTLVPSPAAPGDNFLKPSPSATLVPSPAAPGNQPETQLSGTSVGIYSSPFLEAMIAVDLEEDVINIEAKKPVQRLIDALKLIAPGMLGSPIDDIKSAVSAVDCLASSDHGVCASALSSTNKDLAAETRYDLNYYDNMSSSNVRARKKLRRSSFNCNALDVLESKSTLTSSSNPNEVEVIRISIEREIKEINWHLIDTVVSMIGDTVGLADHIVSYKSEVENGILIRFSFLPVSISPNELYRLLCLLNLSTVLLVPLNYPKHSPVLLDDDSKLSSDITEVGLAAEARSRFRRWLRSQEQPMSVGKMAKLWDCCIREAISEYAEVNGGGTFSSRNGTWISCVEC